MNSRTRTWAPINLCSLCPCPTLNGSLSWTPLPPGAKVHEPVLTLLFGFPLFPLLLLLSCPFVSWPGSFHHLYFFFLFSIPMMGAQLARSLILSCDSHHPCLKKFSLHVSHWSWHQSWERLSMTSWTFSECELCNSTNDLTQCNCVLNYSLSSPPVQYVKL